MVPGHCYELVELSAGNFCCGISTDSTTAFVVRICSLIESAWLLEYLIAVFAVCIEIVAFD